MDKLSKKIKQYIEDKGKTTVTDIIRQFSVSDNNIDHDNIRYKIGGLVSKGDIEWTSLARSEMVSSTRHVWH